MYNVYFYSIRVHYGPLDVNATTQRNDPHATETIVIDTGAA